MSKINIQDALKTAKCWRCRGDGSYWICNAGVNPFLSGGWNAARAMRKVDPCRECKGTGWIRPKRTALSSINESCGGVESRHAGNVTQATGSAAPGVPPCQGDTISSTVLQAVGVAPDPQDNSTVTSHNRSEEKS